MTNHQEVPQPDLPLACNLVGHEQALRNTEVAELFKNVQQVNELPDGFAFQFPDSEAWASSLLQFILTERKCCPFFTFELIFEPAQNTIQLSLRGTGDVKQFIRHEIPGMLP